MKISCENVEVHRNELVVLKDINFELAENTNYLVLGEGGSGKSTFIDILAGKLFATKGQVKRNVKTILVPRDYGFHKIVGAAYQYYQQRFNAFDSEIGPTVYEVLQNQIIPIGTVDLKSIELKKPEYDDSWVLEVTEMLKISHLLQRKITSLSNGETRRTLIAFSLLQRPEVLLLDNPFTGLDIASREALKAILGNLKHTQVILACSLNDAPESFDTVIALENGEIKYAGSKSNYTETPISTESVTDILKGINLENSFDDFEIAIKLESSFVNYGEKVVLDNVNWEVKKGERWALMGPNGSGKSSLLSLLTGDNPQCYKNKLTMFDKRRGSGESIWDLKKKIGFVSPELHLYFNKNITVWKAVGSGFFDSAGLYNKLTEEQFDIIHKYLALMGILPLKDRRLNQLSFGQQRLVFLARALVKNPPLLLLDEPCQGLDYNQMVYFRTILENILAAYPKTLVFVTHYEDEIPNAVNKRINLFDGRVIEKGL